MGGIKFSGSSFGALGPLSGIAAPDHQANVSEGRFGEPQETGRVQVDEMRLGPVTKSALTLNDPSISVIDWGSVDLKPAPKDVGSAQEDLTVGREVDKLPEKPLETRPADEKASSEIVPGSYEALKSKFLGDGALNGADFKVLESLPTGTTSEANIADLAELAFIKGEFELYGKIPEYCEGIVERVAQSKDPGLSGAARNLLASMENEALSPSIQPTYEKFKARFLRDGSLGQYDQIGMTSLMKISGEGDKNRLGELMNLTSLKETYDNYEDLNKANVPLLRELAASKDPDLSRIAGNLMDKVEASASRPRVAFTTPLPSRAAIEFKTYSAQDDRQKDLLAASLTNDPQVMGALRNFSTLSLNDKMNLAQTIANKQAAIYGFKAEPVIYNPFMERGALATHNSVQHQIAIGPKVLSNPGQLLNTITHEESHAYQAQTVAKLNAGTLSKKELVYKEGTASRWRNNQNAYVAPPFSWERNDDPVKNQANLEAYKLGQKAYMEQPIEKHAYEVGDRVASQVMNKVKESP